MDELRPDDRSVKDRSGVTPVTDPSGFGGWLVMLAIGVFISPVVTGVKLLQSGDLQANGDLHHMEYGEAALYLVLLILEIATAIAMLRRSRQFPSLFVVTSIATILFLPLVLIWYSIVGSSLSSRSFLSFLGAMMKGRNYPQWISTTITVGIWMLYVLRSRRVANTFIR